MKTAIGIDIGGTSAKMGVVSDDGQILRFLDLPIQHQLPADELVKNLINGLQDLKDWSLTRQLNPIGLSVSICGYMDPSGEQPDNINIHSLDGYPLKTHLQNDLRLPAVLDNDMNCGVLGEYYFGAGKGIDRLMVMTIGFGIGMGMMTGGRVVRTNAGTTGNPGHVLVEPDGPYCTAGCRGCLEAVASAGPIGRLAEDLARSKRPTMLKEVLIKKGCLTPEDVFKAAEAGDKPACEIWEQVGIWLGRGLITWVQIFGPEVVLVGGGVAKAGRWFIPSMENKLRRSGEPYFVRRVRDIKPAGLGRNAAVLGAACHFFYPENAPTYR